MFYYRQWYAITILVFAFTTAFAHSAQEVPISRYTTASLKPKNYQVDLLSQTIQVHFPQGVQTIGGAMNYLLRLSGYSLVSENQRGSALKITLQKPLPVVDRNFGPMTLKDALTTLAGPAFYLIQNSLTREVNFLVKPAYAKYKESNHKI
jgi:conjugative transfer region protein (TIGR03748 family)